MRVTHIDQLVERQTAMDTEGSANAVEVQRSHAEHMAQETARIVGLTEEERALEPARPEMNATIVMEPLAISFAEPLDVDCACCGSPVFRIREKTNGRRQQRCLECINATACLSQHHRNRTRSICIEYTPEYDRYGLLTAVNRRELMLEDRFGVDRDGNPRRYPGIKTWIAAGFVEIDDDTNIVLIHDVVHDWITEHCRGCERVRHLGCTRDCCDPITGDRVCEQARWPAIDSITEIEGELTRLRGN